MVLYFGVFKCTIDEAYRMQQLNNFDDRIVDMQIVAYMVGCMMWLHDWVERYMQRMTSGTFLISFTKDKQNSLSSSFSFLSATFL
ncbi:hypothetical protein QTP88_022471 [Uroleucon formosanum]